VVYINKYIQYTYHTTGVVMSAHVFCYSRQWLNIHLEMKLMLDWILYGGEDAGLASHSLCAQQDSLIKMCTND
jgi:hypothetical protein